jgi:hypothetical protein
MHKYPSGGMSDPLYSIVGNMRACEVEIAEGPDQLRPNSGKSPVENEGDLAVAARESWNNAQGSSVRAF